MVNRIIARKVKSFGWRLLLFGINNHNYYILVSNKHANKEIVSVGDQNKKVIHLFELNIEYTIVIHVSYGIEHECTDLIVS